MASEYKPNLSVRTITASATLTKEDAGTNIVMSAAAGLTVTLPLATGTGSMFDIFAATTITSNNYIIKVAPGTDVMAGVLVLSTDISGVSMPTGATADTITMNGTTKGGILGSSVRLIDVKTGLWAVSGMLVTSGTEADPFSATVT